MSSTKPAPLPETCRTPAFTGRLQSAAGGGFYPAAHRYELHLALSSPAGLRIAITHDLLRLADQVPLRLLPAVPEDDGGHPELAGLYEASRHGHRGPAAGPVLADRWTGRIVSDHAPHIVADLATHFGDPGVPLLPDSPAERAELAVLEARFDRDITEAAQQAGRPGADPEGRHLALHRLFTALNSAQRLLRSGPYLLGDTLTVADVHLWVTLVQLDTVHRWHLDADTVRRLAAYREVWAYARRLLALPEFGGRLRVADITARHHAHCRGLEAAGAAVRIIDWEDTAHVPRGVPLP